DGLAAVVGSVDNGPDHSRCERAFCIIRQHYGACSRHCLDDMRDQRIFTAGIDRRCRFPIRSEQMRRMMLRYKTYLARGLTASINNKMKLDQRMVAECLGQLAACFVIADGSHEYATRAEGHQVASDVAGSADHQFRAFDRDDRRWRLRRNPRDLAI